jgi:Mannosyltransferase (PIG-V)
MSTPGVAANGVRTRAGVGAVRGALGRWAARPDMRAALLGALGLRLYCSAVAALTPLLLPAQYPWQGHFLSDHFTVASATPTVPQPVYTPLDYLVRPWERWDTLWFTDIAQHGYAAYGSTAFMPLYPALMRVTSPLLGGQLVAAALLIATVATFFALLALYRLAERLAPGRGVGPYTLLAAVLLPIAFFLVAGYTESLFLALSLWAILAALDGRWRRFALLAGLAALTRQQGLVLAALAAPAIWSWLVQLVRSRKRISPRAAPWAAVAAGATPVLVYGAWIALLRFAVRAPLPWDALASPRGWYLRAAWPGPGLLADIQTLITPPFSVDTFNGGMALDVVLSVAAAALLIAGARRLPGGLTLYLTAMWCSALVKVLPTGQTMSAGRYMLQLTPLCVLPAGWLAHSGRLVRASWILGAGITLTICLGLFVLWNWMG